MHTSHPITSHHVTSHRSWCRANLLPCTAHAARPPTNVVNAVTDTSGLRQFRRRFFPGLHRAYSFVSSHVHALSVAALLVRGRQVRKWFTRRVLRLPGGSNYGRLPYRLRQTWYMYHKVRTACAHLLLAHRTAYRLTRCSQGTPLWLVSVGKSSKFSKG